MRRRSRISFTTADDSVVGEVNTTPLIDVMLVLLILCITSIPLMHHKVLIKLPGEGPLPTLLEPPIHRLTLDAAGRLSWNGAPTSLAALPGQLEVMARDPRSQLEIRTDGAARYEEFDGMLAVVKKSGVDWIAFPDNRLFAPYFDSKSS